jgi:hypothetical protein
MKAIETIFDGYRFRSRLEARWAVFFKTLNIYYEYEKEGYDLDGLYYLPDFYLPQFHAWIEIKGGPLSKIDREKAARLALAMQQQVYIFFTTPGEGPGIALAPFGLPHTVFSISSMQKVLEERSDVHWISSEEFTFTWGGGDFDRKLFWSAQTNWNECSTCGTIGLYGLGGLRPYGDCPPSCQQRAIVYSSKSQRLNAAFAAARQARFEHGEKPR